MTVKTLATLSVMGVKQLKAVVRYAMWLRAFHDSPNHQSFSCLTGEDRSVQLWPGWIDVIDIVRIKKLKAGRRYEPRLRP